MKRILRQLAVFLVLLLLFTIVRFPYDDYAEEAFTSFKQKAAQHGVRLDAGRTEFSFPATIGLGNLGVLLPARPLPIPLFVESAIIKLRLLPFFALHSSFAGAFKIYGGTLNSNITYGLLSREATLHTEGEKIDLSMHPLLKANGIGGLLALKLTSTVLPATISDNAQKSSSPWSYVIDFAELEMSVENGRYDGGHLVGGVIKLPKASEISANLQADKNKDKVLLKKVQVFSSLGELSGNGDLRLSDAFRITRANCDFAVKLTPQGTKEIGPYLALAAKLPVDSPGRDYRIHVEQKEGEAKPNISVSPGS
jgi:type II secretion system protein N